MQLITYVIKEIFMPLAFVGIVLTIAGNLSYKFKIVQLTDMINSIIKWGLGILLTVFVGIISIQSMFAPGIDGKAVMMAKFSVKTFVPVVGNILSDTVELVGGCAELVKNALGVAGLLGIVIICAIPLIKVLAQIGILKASAALIQPISDERVIKCLTGLSGGLTLIFIMMLSLSLLFFINVTMIINIGSAYGVH
jgi:stage III sporulation protein AE